MLNLFVADGVKFASAVLRFKVMFVCDSENHVPPRLKYILKNMTKLLTDFKFKQEEVTPRCEESKDDIDKLLESNLFGERDEICDKKKEIAPTK